MKATVKIRALKLEAEGLTDLEMRKMLKGITKLIIPEVPKRMANVEEKEAGK